MHTGLYLSRILPITTEIRADVVWWDAILEELGDELLMGRYLRDRVGEIRYMWRWVAVLHGVLNEARRRLVNIA
jgi:hypothetical protein